MKGMMDMIVIGADTHKRSHTLVAVEAATGRTRGELEIAATGQGEIEALRFGAGLDDERGLPACVLAPGTHARDRR